MTGETPEQKLISALIELLLQQSDIYRKLMELLDPEAKAVLIKIGRLPEKPIPPPRNVI